MDAKNGLILLIACTGAIHMSGFHLLMVFHHVMRHASCVMRRVKYTHQLQGDGTGLYIPDPSLRCAFFAGVLIVVAPDIFAVASWFHENG